MKKTKFIIIRHGQSLGNANNLYLGHTDLDLSELGYRQAQITAEHLKNEKIDAIFTSDLKRAHNTVVPHAKMRGLEVVDRCELREIYLGDWEGCAVEELLRDEHEAFVVGWKQNFGTFTMPNGESTISAGERMYDELLRIAREMPGKTVLIGAHAAIIRAFWGKVSGYSPEKIADAVPFPTNASYSVVEFDGENFVPIEYSVDSHFDSSLVTVIK